jgi:hypothetical protein
MLTLLLTYLLNCSVDSLNEGKIITNKETFQGNVQVDLERNQAVLKEGNSYTHHYARDIRQVTVVKPEGKIIKYVSASFGLNADFFLFEQLSNGKIELLYREGLKLNKYDDVSFPPFFMRIENSVYSIEEKKQVLEVFDDQKSAIKDFIKTGKIEFDSRDDLKKLFDYYNSL